MKLMKRILSLLLCLAMVLSLAPTWVLAAEDAEGSREIFFDNSVVNWNNVNVYFWRTSGGGLTNWPGEPMEKVDDTHYSYVLPGEATMVIFNNGARQTGDLALGEENCFKLTNSNGAEGFWYDYSYEHDQEEGTHPTVLIVGGVSVDVSQDASGDAWVYDYETNTLTVTGDIMGTVTEDAKDSAIYVDKDLNVVFSGTEEDIHVDGTYGIYSEAGDLHLTVNEGVGAYIWTNTATAIYTPGDVTLDGSGEISVLYHVQGMAISAANLVIRDLSQLYADEIVVAQSMTVDDTFLWCTKPVSIGGELTIQNSHVRANSEQAAFAPENCDLTDSVIFNDSSIYVAGHAALRADEGFYSGDTVTYSYGATLDPGDYRLYVEGDAAIYTTAEDGTVTQHIHNTDGGIAYEYDGDGSLHKTTKVCADCPADYVFSEMEDHVFGEDGTCTLCGATESYDLLVGGVMVDYDNAADILGDGTASYNNETNTLTLKDANITDGEYTEGDTTLGAGIMAVGALTIELVGDNYVSGASSDIMSIGIFCVGMLTFAGSGTLTVDCGTGEEMSGALFAAVMTVEEEATVTAENTVIALELTNNGTLNALVGGSIPTNNYEVYGNVTLTEDLEVTRETDPDSGCGSITIMEGAVLTISDGVTLTIGRTDKEDSIINNGKVILEGTGTIVNNGTGSCSETAAHCYADCVCLICGDPSGHSYEDGFCTACDGYEPAVDSDEDGYYEISNAGQLYWFADYINNEYNSAYAKLMNDIVIPASAPNWVPIGGYYAYSPYCGAFDGQGHTISGLKCVSEGKYVGLFGLTGYNYEIKNIGILNSYFEGTDYVGGLIGSAESYVSNCYVANTTIKGDGNYVGGLVGYNSSSIENCYVNTSGLVGYSVSSYGATVTNSYYLSETDDGSGGKTAEQFESGEVAYLLQSGIVGEEIYDEDLQDWVTGEVPHVWGQSIGADSYPVLGGAKVYRVTGTPCTAAYGYANVEDAVADIPHDFTDNNGFCKHCDVFEPAVLNGSGVYEIGNAGQLYWFAALVKGGAVESKAVLTADLVINENVLAADGTLNGDGSDFRIWTPIAMGTIFNGTFDGAGHTISGLYFNDGTADGVGLFSYTGPYGVIQDVGIVDSYIHGNRNVGGLVGQCYGSAISGCYNAGTVSNAASFIGGVVGSADSAARIVNCYNSGTVIGDSQPPSNSAGGVIGQLGRGSSVEQCYNTGSVNGANYVGGVAGSVSGGSVEQCYNTGSVNGAYYVGGVAGRNQSGGKLASCFNAASVSASGFYIGGICGINNDTECTITGCYYNKEVYSGAAVGTDNNNTATVAEGKTTAQFASGEVCWLLNNSSAEGVWGQELGTNDIPILGDPKVYYSEDLGYYNLIGWMEQNGSWYYYDTETEKPVTGICRVPYPTEAIGGVTYEPKEEDLAGDPAYGYTDSETSLFVFDENGVFQSDLNGRYMDGETMHWAVNGQLPWHVGLVQDGEDYYYFRGENQMAAGNVYVGRNTTELEVVIGGVYTFGEDGKLLKLDGIAAVNSTLYYYEDYRLVMGAGLVKVEDSYYYVRSSGAVVVGQEYWVANVNEYTDITPGFYTFDENGVMQIPDTDKNGVYAEDGGLYYYENGYRAYKGLIQYTDGESYNGEWIYVRSNGQLAVGDYWVTNVGDSAMAQGMYSFDELGRMEAVKDGIVAENGGLYYYEAGILQYGLGLVKLEDGSYIYVRSNGALAVGVYWVTNTNGLMEEGLQTFGKDGKLIVQ